MRIVWFYLISNSQSSSRSIAWMRQWDVNNLPKVVAQQRHGRGSNPRPMDRKSNALPLSHAPHPLAIAPKPLDTYYTVSSWQCLLPGLWSCSRQPNWYDLCINARGRMYCTPYLIHDCSPYFHVVLIINTCIFMLKLSKCTNYSK